jgi:transcriptional regulator with XRE-family HTH domain
MNTIATFLSSFDDGDRLLAEERLIVDVTEVIAAEMAKKGMTKAALAKELGRSKAYVSQLLGGSRNMTLRTLAEIAHALDVQPEFRLAGFRNDDEWKTAPERVAKVIRLHPEATAPVTAANNDSGWCSPLRVVNG